MTRVVIVTHIIFNQCQEQARRTIASLYYMIYIYKRWGWEGGTTGKGGEAKEEE